MVEHNCGWIRKRFLVQSNIACLSQPLLVSHTLILGSWKGTTSSRQLEKEDYRENLHPVLCCSLKNHSVINFLCFWPQSTTASLSQSDSLSHLKSHLWNLVTRTMCTFLCFWPQSTTASLSQSDSLSHLKSHLWSLVTRTMCTWHKCKRWQWEGGFKWKAFYNKPQVIFF